MFNTLNLSGMLFVRDFLEVFPEIFCQTCRRRTSVRGIDISDTMNELVIAKHQNQQMNQNKNRTENFGHPNPLQSRNFKY